MGWIDLDSFYNYTNNVVTYKSNPKKEDIPFELKHIFDVDKGGYVTNSKHCCYYSPKSKCKYCTHRKECIFDLRVWEVLESVDDVSLEIRRIRECIKDFRRIIDAHWNGEIIYHDELSDLYDIRIVRDGDEGLSFSVDVVDNFRGRVNSRIREFELLLRELNRLRK